jgi:hypothetical protein
VRFHQRPFSGFALSRFAWLCALGLCALLQLSSVSHAARPMITDDARLVDEKSCQVESWTRNNRSSHEFWALPSCNVNGNLELALGGSYVRELGQSSELLDTLLQAKTLFRPLTVNDWGFGLAVGSVSHHHLADRRDYYAYVPASYSFKDDLFVAHTNIGWLREQATGRQLMTWGLGSETQLTDRSWLVAETFGQSQGKPFFQVGVRYWIVRNHIQIDTTLGNRFGGNVSQSFSGNSQERWLSIGLRLLSVPFLP